MKTENIDSSLRKALRNLYAMTAAAAIILTAILAGSLVWNLNRTHQETLTLATKEGEATINKDLSFRYWATKHGGVYVPATADTPPNPYLSNIPDRDISLPSGKQLTLMNPAYVMRQTMKMYEELYGTKGHLTSLKLLNPVNKPDEWELKALESFERGVKEATEFTKINGKPYLRVMRPAVTVKGCLKCHGIQGYKEGDIRGGIAVSVPMTSYLTHEKHTNNVLIFFHLVLWILGLCATGYAVQKNRKVIIALENSDQMVLAERTLKEKELEESNKRFQIVLDSLDASVYVADMTTYEILFINRYGRDIWGDAVGKKCWQTLQSGQSGPCPFCTNARLVLPTGEAAGPLLWEFQNTVNKRWYECRDHAIRWPDGRLVRMEIAADITERRQSEIVLRESRDILVNAFNKSPLMKTLSDLSTGKYLEVNDSFCGVSGFSREEVIGKTAIELGWISKDERMRMMQKVQQDGSMNGMELSLRSKNGKNIICRYWGTIIHTTQGDKLFSAAEDITERRQLEESARKARETLDKTFQSMNSALFILDNSNPPVVTECNAAATRIFGYERGEILGHTTEFLHVDAESLSEFQRANYSAVKEHGQLLHFEFRMKRRSGEIFPSEHSVSPLLDDHGGRIGWVSIVEDIAERRQTEKELKKIEWMLSDRPVVSIEQLPDAADQGYGDLTELNRNGIILTSIESSILANMMKEYLVLLETSSAVYEKNGDYALGIFSSKWCRLMDRTSRKLCNTEDDVEALNSGKWLCHESCWTNCSKESIAKRGPVDIECNGGIRLYAIPVFAGNEVIGSINFGYGDPPQDPARLRELADLYKIEYEELRKEASAYDTRPYYVIEMAKKRLSATAFLIGELVGRKRAEIELELKSKELGQFFNVSLDLLCIADTDGNFRRLNKAWEQTLGYSREELMSGKFLDYIHPDDLARTLEAVATLAAQRAVINFVNRYRCKDNTYRWLEWRSAPSGKLIYAAASDITERKHKEEELKKLSHKISLILNSAGEGIYGVDRDGKVLFINPAAALTLGYEVEELIGRQSHETWHHHYPDGSTFPIEQCALNKALSEGLPSTAENSFFWKKYGTKFPVEYSSTPMFEADKLVGAVVIFRDITSQLLEEQELKKLEDQLRHAQKMEAVGTLAGGIAHDFNNILNVILGYGSLVMNRISDDQLSKEQMKEVLAAADRAANLTKRLLLFSRKKVAEVKSMDVNEIVLNMEKMLMRIIGEDIKFVVELMGAKAMVMADAGQMEQVLLNLATNARDAMPDGDSLTIKTELRQIDAEFIKAYGYGKPGPYAVISVTDTGLGIAKDKQDRIFDPFFTTKEVGKGTGLGLSIVYGIINEHNGFIKVYSEPGEGTTFKIWLPVIEDKTEKKPEAEALTSRKGGTETILVAEDDPSLRKLTSTILETMGYSVIKAEDGEEAITKFMENRDKIALAVLDMIMPKKSGKEACEAIRKESPATKILFVSGYTMDIVKTKELTDAGFDFILKPVLPRELLRKVREVLDR